MSRCFVCGVETAAPPSAPPGLRGLAEVPAERLCSAECAESARRFAARGLAQRQPALAGMLVAALGLLAAALFLASGRDLGRALLVLSLFGAGTTRLAYPDVVPARLVRRVGLAGSVELLQWSGVALCLLGLGLGLAFLVA